MKHFKDKVVFITGAGSGMGRALAKQLIKYGADVIATDINKPSLNSLQKDLSDEKGNITVHKLDVTNKLAFERRLKQVSNEHGQLDFIFNNAGIAIAGEIRDLAWEDWERTIAVDQMGVLYGSLAAYSIMREQGHGHIVNTASVAGLIPTPLLAPYGMAKHAVVGLSTSLRAEAKAFDVKVSVVCPGAVVTSIADGDFARGADIPNVFEEPNRLVTMASFSADDAAKAILKGVRKNQEKIIFPRHGKALVRMYKNTPGLLAVMVQSMLTRYRKQFRN